MANHKSAEKAHRQSLKRKANNKSRSSRIKTFIKKLEDLIAKGTNEEARAALSEVQSELTRGVNANIIKAGTANRKIKRLAAKVKAMVA